MQNINWERLGSVLAIFFLAVMLFFTSCTPQTTQAAFNVVAESESVSEVKRCLVDYAVDITDYNSLKQCIVERVSVASVKDLKNVIEEYSDEFVDLLFNKVLGEGQVTGPDSMSGLSTDLKAHFIAERLLSYE